jgi:LmbE family N-acetylglucosaminyl deacetylase
VFEATVNRDFLIAMMAEGDNSVFSDVPDEERPNPEDLGMPESVITTRLDVGEWADRKRAALLEHHSQVTDTGFFLQFPVESFRAAFGIEGFIHAGVPRPAEFETELLPDPVE